ncbi:uncharacterized protein LOC133038123 [Cannabis sativa]|uniref:uncharacterized protein LOC133038123 n=1 Tax=Cannabis sativa TaxID=3483 RepID=UPI0029CA2EFD|nr:uncharacterized protein LOC133038123 [Cannabis sativa]
MERIRAHLGFDSYFVVDTRGHNGCLALMWKVASEVMIQKFSFNHIDATVHLQNSPPRRFTGVYGEPKWELRFKTWDLLRSLKNDSNLPWCIMGDLNNLGSQLEKRGGRNYPDRLIEGFIGALSDCNLIDLPLVGYPYTWEKGRNSGDLIEERLDKALVTNEWLALYSQPVLYNLEFSMSDHCPIFLVFKGLFPTASLHSFRFENAWLREPLCKQLFEGCWEGSDLNSIQGKLQSVVRDLVSIQQHQEGKANLSEVLAQREVSGNKDQNSFGLTLVTKIVNISTLLRALGKETTVLASFKTTMVDGLTGIRGWSMLLLVSGARWNDPGFLLEALEYCRRGCGPIFHDFFDTGKFLDSINDTHIVLIPKKKNTSQMSDMRPISVCNVLYKITSKVITNRMKGVLDQAISETQSAFVSGRLISNNVMVAFEVMQYLKRKTNGRTGYMALKLDMSKAYDRIEWRFLESVLRVMGFSERWIGLILSCVNSVCYYVINSCQKMGPIIPTRGICQGCPLSPYLFIVCAEGLSSLIKL